MCACVTGHLLFGPSMSERKTPSFRLDIGPCQGTIRGKAIPGKCEHLVYKIQETVTGPQRVLWGIRTGHQIYRTIERHGIVLDEDADDDRNFAHFLRQARANVTRTLKKYDKRPKHQKAAASAGGGDDTAMTDEAKKNETAAAAAPAPAKPHSEQKSKTTVIGGRRSYGAQNRRRLRVYERADGEHEMAIRNGVWKGTFLAGAPMYEARSVLFGDYCSIGFQAAGFRCIDPQNTISVMKTGGVNVTAALARYDALITIWCTAILQMEYFDIPIHVSNVGVVNMTASAGLGVKVNLKALETELNKTKFEDRAVAFYDPDFFPNLVYKDEDHKLAFGVSSRGFVNVVGAKNEAHMEYVRNVLFPRLKQAVQNVTRDAQESSATDAAVAAAAAAAAASSVLGKRKRGAGSSDGGGEEEEGEDEEDVDEMGGRRDVIYLKDVSE